MAKVKHLVVSNLHRIKVYAFNESEHNISNPSCGSPVNIIRSHVQIESSSSHVRFIHTRFASAIDGFARTLAFQTASGMVLIKTVIESSHTRITCRSNSQSFTRTLSGLFVAGQRFATIDMTVTSITALKVRSLCSKHCRPSKAETNCLCRLKQIERWKLCRFTGLQHLNLIIYRTYRRLH